MILDLELSSSKSLYNRYLILQSYNKNLQINAWSDCEDVVVLKKALAKLSLKSTSQEPIELDCGSAGTSFRFLALRVSRQPGIYKLKASPRLLSRPQQELIDILSQLGVQSKLTPTHFEIQSNAWIPPKNNKLMVSRSRSSQFMSSIFLNAWNLDFDLEVHWQGPSVSDSYFDMTFQICKNQGLHCQESDNFITILKNSQILDSITQPIEPDMSSCFSIAALCTIGFLKVTSNLKQVRFQNISSQSMQPDFIFVHELKKMGIPFSFQTENNTHFLKMSSGKHFNSIAVSLLNSPDLFPVFVVLASQARGGSSFKDLQALKHKESDRIQKSLELLDLLKVKYEFANETLKVFGPSAIHDSHVNFNPDQDHRMAMAAALAKFIGYSIHIEHPEVVKKSFPEYWDIYKKVESFFKET